MRRKDREITDREEIRAILERARVLHLGINAGGRPYVVPLHYGLAWSDGLPVFYVHGAREGRKLDLLRRDNRVLGLTEAGERLCVEARGLLEQAERAAERVRAGGPGENAG